MDRVILGKTPDIEGTTSPTYNRQGASGLFISKPNANVMSCSQGDLLFDSTFPNFIQVLDKGVDIIPKQNPLVGVSSITQINTNIENPYKGSNSSLFVHWSTILPSSNLHQTTYSSSWNTAISDKLVKVPSYFSIMDLENAKSTGASSITPLSARISTNTGILIQNIVPDVIVPRTLFSNNIIEGFSIAHRGISTGTFGWSPDSANIVFYAMGMYTIRVGTGDDPHLFLRSDGVNLGGGDGLDAPSGNARQDFGSVHETFFDPMLPFQELGGTGLHQCLDIWRGNKLVYSDGYGFYIYNIDTKVQTQVVDPFYGEPRDWGGFAPQLCNPRWSPDGTKIVYHQIFGHQVGYGHDPYTEKEGTNANHHSFDMGANLLDMQVWTGARELHNCEIWIIDADGTNQTKLTSSRRHSTGASGHTGGTFGVTNQNLINRCDHDQSAGGYIQNNGVCPNFSHDGTKIIFSSTRDYQLEILPAEGTHGYWGWARQVGESVMHMHHQDVKNLGGPFGHGRLNGSRAWETLYLGGELMPEYPPPMPGINDYELYMMNIDGTNQTRLTYGNNLDLNTPGSVSPSPTSNTFIYKLRDSVKITGNLQFDYTASYYSFNLNNVSDKPSIPKKISPSFPAPIRKFGRMSYTKCNESRGEYTDSPVRKKTLSPDNAADQDPVVWSPDGTKIAFISPHEVVSEIIGQHAIDTLRFINDPEITDVSREGDSNPLGKHKNIYIMDLNNIYNIIKINKSSDAVDVNMGGWSPDGTKFAFFERDLYCASAGLVYAHNIGVSIRYVDLTQYNMSRKGKIDIDFINSSSNDQAIAWALYKAKV